MLNSQRCLDGQIFRPRCTLCRELLDLRVAQLFVHRRHEFVVAPLLRRLTLVPEFFVLDVVFADRRTERGAACKLCSAACKSRAMAKCYMA